MEPFNWFMLVVTQHYYDFNGRARRAEFWWFALVWFILVVALDVLGAILGLGRTLAGIFELALLLPMLGVGARRLHDINQSGWFVLIPVMNIIWWAQAGDTGPNPYGPDPKAPA